MEWWVWIVVGFVLLVIEMITPGGFYFAFFGAGALLVGGLAASGLVVTDWVQWFLFSAFAIGSTALFRKRLLQLFGSAGPGPSVDSLVGQTATALDPIDPGGWGKAELRGTPWKACNSGERGVTAGQRCLVERVDGLTLFIRSA